MKKSIKFYYLTRSFYETYKNCKEILKKADRPYAVHIFKYNNLTIAIPMRSKINHSFCIKTIGKKGLDFTKAVVITNPDYITDYIAYINSKEYFKLNKKSAFIEKKWEAFLKTYQKALQTPNTNKNRIILSNSSLQYFHNELGF